MAYKDLLSTAADRAAAAYDDLQSNVSESEKRRALGRAQKVAHLLDDAIRVPGTNYRIGIDAIVGVLPVAGDTLAAAASLYIVAEAARLGVPPAALARMVFNVGVDAAVGSVPLAGDIFDATWKANVRNVALLEEHLDVDGVEVDIDGADRR